MKKELLSMIITGFAAFTGINSQETGYGPGFHTALMTNPAFAGSEGDGRLRMSYLNFYPGQNYNLHSFYVSYDSFFPLIHGGAGAFISNDYTGGIVNDLRGGFAYSFHLQAGRDIFLNAGLGAELIHRGYNRSNMIFADQINPLFGNIYQTSEAMDFRGHTALNIGAGVIMNAGRFLAGLSVGNLTRPDISGSGRPEEKLKRKIILHLSGSFPAGEGDRIVFRPVVYSEIQGSFFTAGAGLDFSAGVLSVNSIMLISNSLSLDLHSGISLNWEHFYLFYNYVFNISSENSLLPASLFQHTGMGISLNYVDKRKTVKTINFPKL